MADVTVVSEQGLERIHFDTLWSTVQDAIAVYAGQRWTERGEHDPGVTLLQAISFAVSDLAYRHTLPFKDLLTPADRYAKHSDVSAGTAVTWLDHDGKLFAPAFGPEWALTCGPVTLDDYRRAVLDLTTKDGVFYFRDVQLAPFGTSERYAYAYNEKRYAFQFVSKETTGPATKLVAGGYRMWVTLNAGVKEKDALDVLKTYLKENRNLCEREITQITTVKREPLISTKTNGTPDFRMVLELRDDTPVADIPETVAEALLAADDWLLPRVVRDTASARLDRGERAERIYEGPRLEHGWIEQMPPALIAKDGTFAARSLSLQDLRSALMSVPNVKSVQWLDSKDQALSPAVLQVPRDQHGWLWLTPDGTLDATRLPSLLVRKRGQPVSVKSPELAAALAAKQEMRAEFERQVMKAPTRVILAGRYRQPGYYRTTGALLPGVYGLQQEASRLEGPATRLMAFLRPFEQVLADTADQLAKLPTVLAFDGRDRDARVWGGADWPRRDEDPLASEQTEVVFGKADVPNAIRHRLNEQVLQNATDGEKELAILNYLLGYFGEQRAARTLLAADETEFRWVQQGYLRQITRLGYERAAISISKISALQRRIAARLGIGSMLFDERLQQAKAKWPENMPFFVIEHQELLPVAPAPAQVTDNWPENQTVKDKGSVNTPTSGNDAGLDILTLKLEGAVANSLQVGQLIELRQGTSEPITAIVIHDVPDRGATSATVTINLGEHARLKRSLAALEKQNPAWLWRLSPTWLTRVVYDFKYDEPPKDLKQPKVRLTVGPSFPVGLKVGDRLACRPKARWQITPTTADLGKNQTLTDIVMEIEAVDAVQGTITVKWVGEKSFVMPQTNNPVVEPVGLSDIKQPTPAAWPKPEDAKQYGWAAPYVAETFSFTLSVVLNRNWLHGYGNPTELDQWIQQIVREEVPSHLVAQVHWLENDSFTTFAGTYRGWQNNSRPVGDQSYSLLSFLGIGVRPADTRTGIGFVQVASPEGAANLATQTAKYPTPYVDAQVVYVAKKEDAVVSATYRMK